MISETYIPSGGSVALSEGSAVALDSGMFWSDVDRLGDYVLSNADSGVAPSRLVARRVGDSLHILQDGIAPNQIALVIGEFFVNDGRLFGQDADGGQQAYTVVGHSAMTLSTLVDGAMLALELNEQGVTAYSSPADMLEEASAVSVRGALASPQQHPEGNHRDAGKHSQPDATSAAATRVGQPGLAVVMDAGVEMGADALSPHIGAVMDDQGSLQGIIAHEGFTDDGYPEIVGTATPGVLVHIYDGIELIGRVRVGEGGEWSFTPRSPLVDGRHELSILHEYPNGDTSDFSALYVINVDKSTPDVPVILGTVDDEGRLTGQIAPGSITDDSRPTVSGTGLGLPICKSLCELMGGNIVVSSVKGEGTRVTLEIPFNVLPDVGEPSSVHQEEVAQEHPAMRILVVDDQQANRVLLTEQLRLFGQTVYSAENGEEGLQLWRQNAIDVIITDCNMPVMSGYEMARAIRQAEDDSAMMPCAIIGFTANAQPEEKMKCRNAGMDDCLFKPVGLKALSRLLMSLAGMSRGYGAAPLVEGDGSIASVLRELDGGDLSIRRMLLEEARQDYVDDLSQLGVQRTCVDPPALARLVHRVKGGAQVLQAKGVVVACMEVERLCDAEHMDHARIIAAIERVEQELALLISQVDAFRGAAGSVA